jgi:hypothetical protein
MCLAMRYRSPVYVSVSLEYMERRARTKRETHTHTRMGKGMQLRHRSQTYAHARTQTHIHTHTYTNTHTLAGKQEIPGHLARGQPIDCALQTRGAGMSRRNPQTPPHLRARPTLGCTYIGRDREGVGIGGLARVREGETRRWSVRNTEANKVLQS